MSTNSSQTTRRLSWFLKITGLLALAAAVILQFSDLKGWLHYPDRQAFLKWALESQGGLPISDPAAHAFVDRFPPPGSVRVTDITFVTKSVLKIENGPVMEASFNYLLRDQSKTSYVATLPEVREWANESSYPWLSWILAVVGLIEVLISAIMEWREERHTPQRV